MIIVVTLKILFLHPRIMQRTNFVSKIQLSHPRTVVVLVPEHPETKGNRNLLFVFVLTVKHITQLQLVAAMCMYKVTGCSNNLCVSYNYMSIELLNVTTVTLRPPPRRILQAAELAESGRNLQQQQLWYHHPLAHLASWSSKSNFVEFITGGIRAAWGRCFHIVHNLSIWCAACHKPALGTVKSEQDVRSCRSEVRWTARLTVQI